jgi:hypothetical protein
MLTIPKALAILSVGYISLTGCGPSFTTFPVDHFDIGEYLDEGAEIEVIQFSGMESAKPPYKHLVHLLVVHQENDTFNMLTLPGIALNAINESSKTWNFYPKSSFMGKSLFESKDLLENESVELNTVQCDKGFALDLSNNYKTVIGVLGKTTEP